MNTNEIDKPDPMSSRWVLVFGSYLVILNLLLLYLLVKLWPGTVPMVQQSSVTLFWNTLQVQLWIETRYLLIVAIAGALGSYIHLATSFADYLGNRQFYKSWGRWYVLRPFIGAALALTLYFAVRGGLIAGTAGAENLSPYGVAAIAALAGMFSKQAADKLKEVFENLFKTERLPRADKLSSEDEAAARPKDAANQTAAGQS